MRIGNAITNPGELRTQIELEQRVYQEDAGGFKSLISGTRKSVWCRWINAHGEEAWQADAAGATKAATLLMRYVPGLDETWRVLYGNQTWEIRSIDNIRERNEWLELKVSRIGVG
jgi:SPP1 family predicted phage head-tail adaptor